MLDNEDMCERTLPILRLRPRVPTELIRPPQRVKLPDGPRIAHPDLIDEQRYTVNGGTEYTPEISMKEYRRLWKTNWAAELKQLKSRKLKVIAAYLLWPSINMQELQGATDEDIAFLIEMYYVGPPIYLSPGQFNRPQSIDLFGADWALNACGIYYRHHYSPGWVTADHNLWLPSFTRTNLDDDTEQSRRNRAKSFLKHNLDNEKWNKSEYAWDADAWTDVFSPMRNDPVLSVDKHEYNTIRQETHPVSCLLTGESEYIKRKPDVTFGLATFQQGDYDNAVADSDLDRDRLEALLLHRQCGLISDPRWGETNLVFPFAVYEAKGWSGNAREARWQACSAGKVYLDLLDNLSRQPGKNGDTSGRYQTDQSRNSQVFVYTSFGAHWHILVGYKRPRLRREHAGHEGLSKSVYIFQRIWSGRVTTERVAWELLSLVDQIHRWGATMFRDFVIQHLKPWHDFVNKCYINDVDFMKGIPKVSSRIVDGKPILRAPVSCLLLPEWTKHVEEAARLGFQERAVYHLEKAWSRYRSVRAKELPSSQICTLDDCGALNLNDSGYPLASTEEYIMHLREVHGAEDAHIAELVHDWETADSLRPSGPPLKATTAGELLTSRDARKRGPTGTINGLEFSKRRR